MLGKCQTSDVLIFLLPRSLKVTSQFLFQIHFPLLLSGLIKKGNCDDLIKLTNYNTDINPTGILEFKLFTQPLTINGYLISLTETCTKGCGTRNLGHLHFKFWVFIKFRITAFPCALKHYFV